MKAISLLLIPPAVLLVSACAPEVVQQPGYGGPGYYGHETVYVQGGDDRDHDHRDYNDRNQTDVTVNRTTINDRTENRTTVNDVNAKKSSRTKAKVVKPAAKSDDHKKQNNGDQPGDQQPH